MQIAMDVGKRIMATHALEILEVGNVGQMRKVNRILDMIELTEKQKQEAGVVVEGNKARWEDTKTRWELEIEESDLEFLMWAVGRSLLLA